MLVDIALLVSHGGRTSQTETERRHRDGEVSLAQGAGSFCTSANRRQGLVAASHLNAERLLCSGRRRIARFMRFEFSSVCERGMGRATIDYVAALCVCLGIDGVPLCDARRSPPRRRRDAREAIG